MGLISTLSFTTTGRLKMPCIPKIADCGGLMMGVPIKDPYLFIVTLKYESIHFLPQQYTTHNTQQKRKRKKEHTQNLKIHSTIGDGESTTNHLLNGDLVESSTSTKLAQFLLNIYNIIKEKREKSSIFSKE